MYRYEIIHTIDLLENKETQNYSLPLVRNTTGHFVPKRFTELFKNEQCDNVRVSRLECVF